MYVHVCSSLSNHILHTDSHIFHDSWECFLSDIANFSANVVLQLIKRPWSGIGINLVFYVVLIGDVLLNVVADIATRITGEAISVSNTHLDQNERLDDFGSRTRPQFFFLTVI